MMNNIKLKIKKLLGIKESNPDMQISNSTYKDLTDLVDKFLPNKRREHGSSYKLEGSHFSTLDKSGIHGTDSGMSYSPSIGESANIDPSSDEMITKINNWISDPSTNELHSQLLIKELINNLKSEDKILKSDNKSNLELLNTEDLSELYHSALYSGMSESLSKPINATQVLESISKLIKIDEMSPLRIKVDLPDFIAKTAKVGQMLDHSLTDRYELLGEIDIDNNHYKYWLNNDKSESLVTENTGKFIGKEQYNNIVVTLDFEKSNIKIDNLLKIDLAKSNKRSRSLTTYLYLLLAHKGYNVVSDTIQYEAAVRLWKRISGNSGFFKVKLFDTTKSEYIKNSNGLDIEYDPDTINDEEVWSEDSSKENIVLVLSCNESISITEVFDNPWDLTYNDEMTEKVKSYFSSKIHNNDHINNIKAYVAEGDNGIIIRIIRNGFLELHHISKEGYIGKLSNLNTKPNPRFISTMYKLYKEHLDKGKYIKILSIDNGSKLHDYYKNFANHLLGGMNNDNLFIEESTEENSDGDMCNSLTIMQKRRNHTPLLEQFAKSINKSTVVEKLSKDQPLSEWIDDFIKSKNKRFEGKTSEERRRMAKGAYFSAQESLNREPTINKWYIVDFNNQVCSGYYTTEKEAKLDTKRLDWYSVDKYNILRGSESDSGGFILESTGSELGGESFNNITDLTMDSNTTFIPADPDTNEGNLLQRTKFNYIKPGYGTKMTENKTSITAQDVLNRFKTLNRGNIESDHMYSDNSEDITEEFNKLITMFGEAVAITPDIDMDQLNNMFDAAKKGLGIINKFKDKDNRKKYASQVMTNLNKIRAALSKYFKVEESNNYNLGDPVKLDQFLENAIKWKSTNESLDHILGTKDEHVLELKKLLNIPEDEDIPLSRLEACINSDNPDYRVKAQRELDRREQEKLDLESRSDKELVDKVKSFGLNESVQGELNLSENDSITSESDINSSDIGSWIFTSEDGWEAIINGTLQESSEVACKRYKSEQSKDTAKLSVDKFTQPEVAEESLLKRVQRGLSKIYETRKINESPSSDNYDAYSYLSSKSTDTGKGRFKLKDGERILGSYESESDALAAYSKLPNSRGVKLIKESLEGFNWSNKDSIIAKDVIETVLEKTKIAYPEVSKLLEIKNDGKQLWTIVKGKSSDLDKCYSILDWSTGSFELLGDD